MYRLSWVLFLGLSVQSCRKNSENTSDGAKSGSDLSASSNSPSKAIDNPPVEAAVGAYNLSLTAGVADGTFLQLKACTTEDDSSCFKSFTSKDMKIIEDTKVLDKDGNVFYTYDFDSVLEQKTSILKGRLCDAQSAEENCGEWVVENWTTDDSKLKVQPKLDLTDSSTAEIAGISAGGLLGSIGVLYGLNKLLHHIEARAFIPTYTIDEANGELIVRKAEYRTTMSENLKYKEFRYKLSEIGADNFRDFETLKGKLEQLDKLQVGEGSVSHVEIYRVTESSGKVIVEVDTANKGAFDINKVKISGLTERLANLQANSPGNSNIRLIKEELESLKTPVTSGSPGSTVRTREASPRVELETIKAAERLKGFEFKFRLKPK